MTVPQRTRGVLQKEASFIIAVRLAQFALNTHRKKLDTAKLTAFSATHGITIVRVKEGYRIAVRLHNRDN